MSSSSDNKETLRNYSRNIQNCRRRLQNTFENFSNKSTNNTIDNNGNNNNRSVLSVITIQDNTRRIIRNSGERITKTINTVRTTIGTISQKFRISTKRRQILEEGPMTPDTPHTFAKQILGRTPTKLYSPFGIDDTPKQKQQQQSTDNKGNKENLIIYQR